MQPSQKLQQNYNLLQQKPPLQQISLGRRNSRTEDKGYNPLAKTPLTTGLNSRERTPSNLPRSEFNRGDYTIDSTSRSPLITDKMNGKSYVLSSYTGANHRGVSSAQRGSHYGDTFDGSQAGEISEYLVTDKYARTSLSNRYTGHQDKSPNNIYVDGVTSTTKKTALNVNNSSSSAQNFHTTIQKKPQATEDKPNPLKSGLTKRSSKNLGSRTELSTKIQEPRNSMANTPTTNVNINICNKGSYITLGSNQVKTPVPEVANTPGLQPRRTPQKYIQPSVKEQRSSVHDSGTHSRDKHYTNGTQEMIYPYNTNSHKANLSTGFQSHKFANNPIMQTYNDPSSHKRTIAAPPMNTKSDRHKHSQSRVLQNYNNTTNDALGASLDRVDSNPPKKDISYCVNGNNNLKTVTDPVPVSSSTHSGSRVYKNLAATASHAGPTEQTYNYRNGKGPYVINADDKYTGRRVVQNERVEDDYAPKTAETRIDSAIEKTIEITGDTKSNNINIKVISPQRAKKGKSDVGHFGNNTVEIKLESPARPGRVCESSDDDQGDLDLNIGFTGTDGRKPEVEVCFEPHGTDDIKSSGIYRKLLTKHINQNNFDKPEPRSHLSKTVKGISCTIQHSPSKPPRTDSNLSPSRGLSNTLKVGKPYEETQVKIEISHEKIPSPRRNRPAEVDETMIKTVHNAVNTSQELLARRDPRGKMNAQLNQIIERLQKRKSEYKLSGDISDQKCNFSDLKTVQFMEFESKHDAITKTMRNSSLDASDRQLEDIRASRMAHIKASRVAEMKSSNLRENLRPTDGSSMKNSKVNAEMKESKFEDLK